MCDLEVYLKTKMCDYDIEVVFFKGVVKAIFEIIEWEIFGNIIFTENFLFFE